jgi:hypothetical protein
MEGDYHRFSFLTYIVHPCCPVLDFERNLQFRFLVSFIGFERTSGTTTALRMSFWIWKTLDLDPNPVSEKI